MSDRLVTRHQVLSPLMEDFPLPTGADRRREQDTWHRGVNDSWTNASQPADVAMTPRLNWTAEQHALLLEAMQSHKVYAPVEGDLLTVTWPPEASLWRAGDAFTHADEYCSDHDDNYLEFCTECRGCARQTTEVEPAEWYWSVLLEYWEDLGGGSASLETQQSVEIMVSYVDPREVAYAEGEWGVS